MNRHQDIRTALALRGGETGTIFEPCFEVGGLGEPKGHLEMDQEGCSPGAQDAMEVKEHLGHTAYWNYGDMLRSNCLMYELNNDN